MSITFTTLNNPNSIFSNFRQPRTPLEIAREAAESAKAIKADQDRYKIVGNLEEEIEKAKADKIVDRVRKKDAKNLLKKKQQQQQAEAIKKIEQPVVKKEIVNNNDNKINEKLEENFIKIKQNYYSVTKRIPNVVFNKILMSMITDIKEKKALISKEAVEQLDLSKKDGSNYKVTLNGNTFLFKFI